MHFLNPFSLNPLSLNPLWRTFLFILLSSIVTGSAMIYIQWENIKSELIGELIYTNNIMTSSIQSVLHKNEALLLILGSRLVELGALHQPDSLAQNLINNLLKDNPELAGIGLANPSGQLILTSFNIDRKNLPDLLKTLETKKTFTEALKTDFMVFGRTYYMKALKQWVIPLRYRITNEEGKVIAVMTTGLKLNDGKNLWSTINIPEHMQVLIVRKDRYRQYVATSYSDDMATKYSEPTPQTWVDRFETELIDQFGMDLPGLRSSGKTVALNMSYGDKRIPSIASVSYDPTYKHYTLIITPISYLHSKLLKPASLLLALLFFFNIILYFIFRSNIRIQTESKYHLKYQSTHDQLTDLPNRRYLLNQFNGWQNKHHGQFTIIFIDLDNFKSINDYHGHTVGDQILCEVASRINNIFENSLNIRHGGDEFIILHTEVEQDKIISLSHQFLYQLKKPMITGNMDFSIDASIGITIAPEHGSDIETLLRKAGMAMYEAKRKQSGVYVFSHRLEEQQNRKTAIEHELIHDLENKEFFLVNKPHVSEESKSFQGV